MTALEKDVITEESLKIGAYNPERNTILIGKGLELQEFNLKFVNRHGLIAGATGTGKTVTLQILAEGLSKAGVPSNGACSFSTLNGVKRHPRRNFNYRFRGSG